MGKDDPLELGELDPDVLAVRISERDGKTKREPTELEVLKESRLAEKEKRLAGGGRQREQKNPPSLPRPHPHLQSMTDPSYSTSCRHTKNDFHI